MSIASMTDSVNEQVRRDSQYDGQHHPMSAALLQAAAQAAQEPSESPPIEDEQDPEEPDHDHDQDQDGAVDGQGKRQKRSRACQACRGMKIRCIAVEGQEACRACAKVNRQCIMPGPARKRQKTVHKVAELEKKINALTASLAAKGQQSTIAEPTPPTDSPHTSTTSPHARSLPSRPEKEYSMEELVEKQYPAIKSEEYFTCDPPAETTTDDYIDVITRGRLNLDTATRIYHRWRDEMCRYCPLVNFADNTSIEWLRKKRPMCLLAILGVGSGTILPELQEELIIELSRQLADRVMFYNEKSVDLIQSLLIYPTWYGKHKYAKDLGYFQYIHSSIVMSLDLGLGRRCRGGAWKDEAEDIEMRRTWMACYFLGSTVATVLRIPSLVKWSPYLEECLEVISKSSKALQSDRLLSCLVRLSHIMEDVGLLFHMDDPGSNIPLNDSRTQYHLKMFERNLADWKLATQPYLPKAVLEQYAAVTSLYIHEIALHNEHNVDDFRPMYKANGPEEPHTTKDFLTNAHFESLAICVDSMEQAMLSFFAIEQNIFEGLPAMHMVWIAYVGVAMIRLYGVLKAPNSKYGPIFLPKLKVEQFLDACAAKASLRHGARIHTPAEGFAMAFKKLKIWHVHRNHQHQTDPSSQGTKPDTHDGTTTSGARNKPQIPINNNNNNNINNSTLGPNDNSRSILPDGNTTDPYQLQQQDQVMYGTGAQYDPQQIQQRLSNAGSSTLLDPSTSIDPSQFDIENWGDFSLSELNDFENYMGDAGWMGYLM